MYYKHDHTIKSQELEAIIVERILAMCVKGEALMNLRMQYKELLLSHALF